MLIDTIFVGRVYVVWCSLGLHYDQVSDWLLFCECHTCLRNVKNLISWEKCSSSDRENQTDRFTTFNEVIQIFASWRRNAEYNSIFQFVQRPPHRCFILVLVYGQKNDWMHLEPEEKTTYYTFFILYIYIMLLDIFINKEDSISVIEHIYS